jgi:hypothetical protein
MSFADWLPSNSSRGSNLGRLGESAEMTAVALSQPALDPAPSRPCDDGAVAQGPQPEFRSDSPPTPEATPGKKLGQISDALIDATDEGIREHLPDQMGKLLAGIIASIVVVLVASAIAFAHYALGVPWPSVNTHYFPGWADAKKSMIVARTDNEVRSSPQPPPRLKHLHGETLGILSIARPPMRGALDHTKGPSR